MRVGFVVAGQAAVVHEPFECAFDDPAAGLDVEAAGGGVALDDLEVDAVVGVVFDGFGLVAVVGPGFGDGGVACGDVGEELGAGGGVVDAGGGDGDGEEEAEGVGDDVPFASDDLLGWVDALAGQGTVVEVLMLWLSIRLALGSVVRPSAWRILSRSRPVSWSKMPSASQRAK